MSATDSRVETAEYHWKWTDRIERTWEELITKLRIYYLRYRRWIAFVDDNSSYGVVLFTESYHSHAEYICYRLIMPEIRNMAHLMKKDAYFRIAKPKDERYFKWSAIGEMLRW